MRKTNKFIAALLSVAMIVTMMSPFMTSSAQESIDVAITNLMVDNIVNPIGTDNTTPHFSWTMESDTVGQAQTAYQIVVSTDPTFKDVSQTVWDTNKVQGDVSINVAYEGTALKSSTTYYWNVKVWDKDGLAVSSTEKAMFETAMFEADAWDSANWIRLPKDSDNAPEVPGITADMSKYTIETDFEMQDAFGLVFAAQDKSHFFMWQINNNMENGVEGSWLRPHRWNPQGAMFNPENLPDYKGYKLPDMESGKIYNLKLVVDTTSTIVETYIDGTLVNSLKTNEDLSYGKLGFRQARNAAAGFQEEAYVDNMTVTANDGTVVFAQDFSIQEDTEFDGGTVQDGRLFVTSGSANDVVIMQTSSTSYYRMDLDFTINSGKAGIIYGANKDGNQYFYSLLDANYRNEGKPFLVQNLHYSHGGEANDFDRGAITNITAEDMIGKQHHMTLVATKNGKANDVTIYIDGVVVKHHDNLDVFDYTGKLGFVNQNASDDVTYDNITVKANGIPKLYATFNTDENVFNGGTVADGALNVAGAQTVMLTGITGDIESTTPKAPVNYTLEMDMKMTGDAAGIIFSAENSANMYMWQINGVDHKDADGNGLLYLRPHIWANGAVSAKEININDKFTVDQMKETSRKITIKVTPGQIETLIDGTSVNVFKDANVYDGKIGFRMCTNGTTHEAGVFDNIKVTTYDEEGNPTVKTEYNFDDGKNPFDAGKVVNGEYTCEFGAGDGTLVTFEKSAGNGTPMFRKEFDTSSDKTVASAKMYATSLGVYDISFNGERVGRTTEDGTVEYDEMKPGWTDYNERVLYYTHDVTDMVVNKGTNAILATVGTGWWTGRISYNTYGTKDMAFMAKTIITYTDGSQDVIVTDDSWKSNTISPIRASDIWDGETYDANMEDPTMATSAYDDTEWAGVGYSKDFKGAISAQVGQTIQVRKELERKSAKTTVYEGAVDNGSDHGTINIIKDDYAANEAVVLKAGQTVVYDLGQNMVGWPNITVKGEQGTEVTMRFGEMLNDSGKASRGNDGPEGSIYTANYRSAKSTGTYIMDGSAEGENYTPTFSFYGFRYVEVTASSDVEISKFTAEVLGSAIPESGTIETSNKDVNQLFSNILWGQRGNYLSVPTDCPQRDERLGWTGDTQVFVGAASYNANVNGFFQKWLQDLRDSQKSVGDGSYTDTVPRSAAVGTGAAAWGDAGIIVPYNMYKMYGDTQTVKDMYVSMEKYMAYLATKPNYEGPGLSYGDWLSYDDNNDGEFRRLIAMAYYALDAQLMAEMSTAIGETDKAAHYTDLYGKIKAAFQTRFVNSDGSLKKTQQTAYLMALKVELLPNDASKEMAKNALVQRIKDNGNKLATGFVGTGTITQTLSDIGAGDMAYTLLLQRDNPSWLYSIDQGATTIWERWNSYTLADGFGDVGMNSFNHYSYGAVAEWMYSDMAGIQADAANPGFKHIVLAPQPDTRAPETVPANQEQIKWVNGTYDSAYGTIESNWNIESGMFDYNTVVPANTTATLTMPIISDDSNGVVINGTTYTIEQLNAGECAIAGVTFVSAHADAVVFELASGTHTFTEATVTVGPAGPVVIDPTEDGTIPTDAINNALASDKSTSVEVLMSQSDVANSSIFAAAKAAGKPVMFSILDANAKTSYAWTFAGTGITNTEMNVDLDVKFTSENQAAIEALTGKAPAMYMSFAHVGTLPGQATMKVAMSSLPKASNDTVYLYRFDKLTNTIQLVGNQLAVTDGYITFTIGNGGEYFVTAEKVQQGPVNKQALQMAIDYAQKAFDDGKVDELIDPIKTKFYATFGYATIINNSPTATQQQVDEAWAALMDVIHMLGWTGNKAELKLAIASAELLNLNDYVDTVAFEAALKAAKAVDADEFSLQNDIDQACADLQAAIKALVYKDKTSLIAMISYIDGLDKNLYADNAAKETMWGTDSLLEKAKTILSTPESSQAVIDETTMELVNVAAQLRLQANKETLDKVINEASQKDLSMYTAESVQLFQEALDKAKAASADKTLTADDHQAIIDQLAKDLQEKLVALEPADTTVGAPDQGTDNKPVGGDQNITADGANGTTNSATTGEKTVVPIAIAVAVSTLILAGIAFKKRKN